jgi:hypothetical protein
MPRTRLFLLTSLAMAAFAGNSLLCRLALRHTAIEPLTLRFVACSGAILGGVALVIANRPRAG